MLNVQNPERDRRSHAPHRPQNVITKSWSTSTSARCPQTNSAARLSHVLPIGNLFVDETVQDEDWCRTHTHKRKILCTESECIQNEQVWQIFWGKVQLWSWWDKVLILDQLMFKKAKDKTEVGRTSAVIYLKTFFRLLSSSCCVQFATETVDTIKTSQSSENSCRSVEASHHAPGSLLWGSKVSLSLRPVEVGGALLPLETWREEGTDGDPQRVTTESLVGRRRKRKEWTERQTLGSVGEKQCNVQYTEKYSECEELKKLQFTKYRLKLVKLWNNNFTWFVYLFIYHSIGYFRFYSASSID